MFASGFAEVGDDGRAEQQRLVQAARAGNVRILGPNCIGFTNFADGVSLTFETIAPETIADRPAVGVVTQSGALAGALRIALSAKALGVSEADVIASLEAGDLKGKRIGTQWRVTKSALAEFLK